MSRDRVDQLEGATPSEDQLRIGSDATESHFKGLPLAVTRFCILVNNAWAATRAIGSCPHTSGNLRFGYAIQRLSATLCRFA